MIFIIRHGQTDQNKKGMLLGRTDVPLNERGREEALKAGQLFKQQGIHFQKCYSSPLIRTVETAELVTGFDRSGIEVNDLLMEMDYGPYEGASLQPIPEELRYFFSDFVHHPAPEGMEPLSEVTERMGRFLNELPRGENGHILISTHAIAMKGALEYLTPASHGSYWSKYIGNCAVYCFDRKSDGTFTIPEQYDAGA